MKKLSALLDNVDVFSTVMVSDITNNSRDVVKNTLFLAYKGEKADGRNYILQAVEQGACAIGYEPGDNFVLPDVKIPCIAIKNLKIKQSEIAARFYDFPSTKIPVIGVTGTNGKTSVTHFIAQAMSHCGVIGTVGYGLICQKPNASEGVTLCKLSNTTPDGLQLQKIFSEILSQSAEAVAMEVSSHALIQQRVNAVQFHTAVFTNLTQDHLDFHHTMENYRDAKELLLQQANLKNAVINIDDEAGKYFAHKYKNKLNTVTYSLHDKNADIYVEKCIPTQQGFDLTINSPWGTGDCYLPLIGEFNISNALAVIGVLGIFNMPLENIFKKMSQLKTVAGRMQSFQTKNSPQVIIDYAHTPDALAKALHSIRKHCTGKLICIFGCGGDRDKTKRPKMGFIADQLADDIVITNDNPRSEDPMQIAQEILAGVHNKNKCTLELDRAKAITRAIQHAQPADWILLAGKGHETEQVMRDQTLHHSDIECVLLIFSSYYHP